MNHIEISKFLSYVLRHRPDSIKLNLDENGWANVSEFLFLANENGNKIDIETLYFVVENNSKQRFSFNSDKTKIRANQGHSIEVDLQFKSCIPPDILFHGTASKNQDSILQNGIHKVNRQFVHLSDKYDTALDVGKRHGKPFVFSINAKKIHLDGILFYRSNNGVWLVNEVLIEYLNQLCISHS